MNFYPKMYIVSESAFRNNIEPYIPAAADYGGGQNGCSQVYCSCVFKQEY